MKYVVEVSALSVHTSKVGEVVLLSIAFPDVADRPPRTVRSNAGVCCVDVRYRELRALAHASACGMAVERQT